MGLREEIKKIHTKLVIDINDMTDHDSSEFENFNTALGTYLMKGALSRNRKITDKINALTTKGIVKYGDYSKLKEAASSSGNEDIVARIEEAEEEIRNISARAQSNPPIVQPPVQVSSSSEKPSHSVVYERNQEPSTSSAECNGKKRKVEADDQADPLFYQDDRQRGYYDTRGKKGYLLILNSKENREGTEKDVENLKTFFGKELGFDVDDPRTYKQADLTLKEISECLEAARQSLNNALSSKYYCFICVILSHGNQVGIKAKDGMFKSEEVQKYFNNQKSPNFAGRPKLFFIQACRGQVAQDGVLVDESDDEPSVAPVDLADVTYNIPVDADTLMAYATTPDYTSYSEETIMRGTYFIQAVVNVFTSFHKVDHVEDMMISVKEAIANLNIPVDHNGSIVHVKMMPCTSSTLTKRLKLTPHRPGNL